jgi:hypothetical protein
MVDWEKLIEIWSVLIYEGEYVWPGECKEVTSKRKNEYKFLARYVLGHEPTEDEIWHMINSHRKGLDKPHAMIIKGYQITNI